MDTTKTKINEGDLFMPKRKQNSPWYSNSQCFSMIRSANLLKSNSEIICLFIPRSMRGVKWVIHSLTYHLHSQNYNLHEYFGSFQLFMGLGPNDRLFIKRFLNDPTQAYGYCTDWDTITISLGVLRCCEIGDEIQKSMVHCLRSREGE